MKHHFFGAIVLVTALGLPAVASAGSLTLTMHDGRVTIVAQDVPVRQILDEWARIGRTNIVNADTVSGPPVTMQLVDVPEREALDTLLRSVSGYIAAPREVAQANASVYDRVTIMATSHAPAMSAVPAPMQTFQRPPTRAEDEPVNPMLEQQLQQQQQALQNEQQRLLQQRTQQASPVLTPYPGMQPPAAGQQAPATSGQPGAVPVVTSPRPGALPQPQPGVGVGNPAQPGAVRPTGPGGGGPGGPGGQ